MSLPGKGAFNQPVLEIFGEADEILTVKQIYERLPRQMGLTESDLAEKFPSGYDKFSVRVRVAIAELVNEHQLSRIKHGHYQITPQGKGMIRDDSAVERVAPRPSPERIEPADDKETDDTLGLGPAELMASSWEQLEKDLLDEIHGELRKMPWQTFEFLVLELLKEMGYGDPEHTGRVGDGGIDGIIHQDQLGLEKIYMQAKRWADAVVSRPVVEKFDEDLGRNGANKGVLCTSSRFSEDAKEFAKNVRGKTIVLIDGPALARLMIDHDVGVVTEFTYQVKKMDKAFLPGMFS